MIETVSSMIIEIDVRSFWHAGVGRGGGDDVDALTDKDSDGLPIIRGRHLKGLLRDAAARLVQWEAEGWSAARVNLLFGRKARERDDPDGPQLSAPSCVHFGNGRLPEPIVQRIRSDSALAMHFVRRLASTRIDHETGAALDKSLRSIEVSVPLKLYARLDWAPHARLATKLLDDDTPDESETAVAALRDSWKSAVKECLPLVLAVCSNRSRGFGQALLRPVGG